MVERLGRLGAALTVFTMRWVPDAWVVAVLLSFVVWALAIVVGGAAPFAGATPAPACYADASCGAFDAWSGGIWKLLALASQFALALVAAQAVATARPVHRLMDRLARLPHPDHPRQAIVLMALFSASTAFANWAVNLVMCAAFAPIVAARSPKVDFRLLVATAYLGLGAVWHAGLSGSAPLIAATPDSFLVKQGVLAAPIPIGETLFSTFNLVYVLVIVAVTTTAAALLHPAPESAEPLDVERARALVAPPEPPPDTAGLGPAARLDRSRLVSFTVGVAFLAHLGLRFSREGSAGWDINGYNAAFVGLGLVLHDSPRSFLSACEQGARNAWGVIVQFPLYAGIFGLLTLTGLGAALTAGLQQAGSTQTYPAVVYTVSAAINYLVPSGGSQWVLEAPAILRAGEALGLPPAATTLAFAYGDMSTNLVQPFWAIPLLSVTGVRFGAIMGYCLLLFVVAATVTLGAVLLMPAFF
ncbi:MAG: hypothetical protein RIT45_3113 [Pseudomonadota bacterium]